MPLLIPYDPAGVDGKIRMIIDQIVASIQAWAGRVDGVNADERINQLTSGVASLSTVQTGTIHAYGGATAPTGYLFCDGSAVSRTTYASLYAVIGTSYGAGNGSSTFNIPNLQQRFPLGKASSGTGATLGSTGGAIDHTHTGGSVSGSTANESSHTHASGTYATETHNHGGATDNDAADVEICQFCGDGSSLIDIPTLTHTHSIATQAALDVTGSSAAGSAHSHGAGTLAVGTSGTANPPYQVVNYIVKT